MEELKTTIGYLFTFLAGGGGVLLISYIKTKREQNRADKKQDVDIKSSETDKAFLMYKELFSTLKTDLANIKKGHEDLEKQYFLLKEENAVLRSQCTASGIDIPKKS